MDVPSSVKSSDESADESSEKSSDERVVIFSPPNKRAKLNSSFDQIRNPDSDTLATSSAAAAAMTVSR